MDKTVQAAQTRLLALGYDLGPAKADGIAGRATIAAISKFQTVSHLAPSYPGTLDAVTLAALGVSGLVSAELPWIAHARQFIGLNEVRDAKVLDKDLGVDASAVAWCGAFVGMNIAAALPREPLPANPLWALNWLKFGIEIPLDKPVFGAIGVKSRVGGGHVFFVIGHDKDYWHSLGGNQSNSVSIVKIAKNADIKGLRFPSTYPMPSAALAYSVFNGQLAGSEA
jgi:uncharacterized protein (TIGR02594 family)